MNEKGRDSKEGGETFGGGHLNYGRHFAFYYLYPCPFLISCLWKKNDLHFFMQRRSLSLDHSMIFSYLHSTSQPQDMCLVMKRVYRYMIWTFWTLFQGKKKGGGKQRGKKNRNSTYKPFSCAKPKLIFEWRNNISAFSNCVKMIASKEKAMCRSSIKNSFSRDTHRDGPLCHENGPRQGALPK